MLNSLPMLNTTVQYLRCPRRASRGTSQSAKARGVIASGKCHAELRLVDLEKGKSSSKNSSKGSSHPSELPEVYEVRWGHLVCTKCSAKYPILQGVAIVVPEVGPYLFYHVKGISKIVPVREIPAEFQTEFLEAKEEIAQEHIEEDLEAERVNALYVMNHYLRVSGSQADKQKAWWRPKSAAGSPLIDSLVQEYWDQGPFAQIKKWVSGLSSSRLDAVELGCGVGGLYREIQSALKSYLGVDSSFASIALARHFALGVDYPASIRIPEDLLQGGVSREVKIPIQNRQSDRNVDFIVGDLETLPLRKEVWDLSLSLNTMDMLDRPENLPQIQADLLKPHGIAIQSCPYIWHEKISKHLRKVVPKDLSDSALAVEWLYEKTGMKILKRVEHLPWLFFKHCRQLEIYSVHLFTAEKR